jgi:hypothetical protein
MPVKAVFRTLARCTVREFALEPVIVALPRSSFIRVASIGMYMSFTRGRTKGADGTAVGAGPMKKCVAKRFESGWEIRFASNFQARFCGLSPRTLTEPFIRGHKMELLMFYFFIELRTAGLPQQ